MEVQALETLAMAAGVKSSLSMYGCILVITASGIFSWRERVCVYTYRQNIQSANLESHLYKICFSVNLPM